MGALANFQELARQEAIEFQLEQKLERFERERSDIILRNIQASYDFLKLVGEVSNLYFPVMFDIFLGVKPEQADGDNMMNSESPFDNRPTPPGGPEID